MRTALHAKIITTMAGVEAESVITGSVLEADHGMVGGDDGQIIGTAYELNLLEQREEFDLTED